MDVKQYYRKLRDIEAGIPEAFIRVISLETSDGGKPGVVSEVSREQAAKLLVEGRVAIANESDDKAFLDKRDADKKAFEKTEMAKRLQVTIVSTADDSAKTDDAKASEPRVKR